MRDVQALLRGLVEAGVKASVSNFDMSDIKYEVRRIERIEKIRELKFEWGARMKLEEERRVEIEKCEKIYRLRGC